MSKLSLKDPKLVRMDNSGRSLAYFSLKPRSVVDSALIAELKAAAKEMKKDLRLCLHPARTADLHQMVVLAHKGGAAKPHKHPTKSEGYHVVEGKAIMYLLSEEGKLLEKCALSKDDNFIFWMSPNTYHCLVPSSDLFIYLESRPGPFEGDHESVYPSWSFSGDGK